MVVVVEQRGPTQVVEEFGMGNRWLLGLNRCGVVSAVNFTDSNIVLYFDGSWLTKATSIFWEKDREC